MNENLDLIRILKDAPKGTSLYSPLFGEVILDSIKEEEEKFPIWVEICNTCNRIKVEPFTKEGKFSSAYPGGECVLFPSKENRDWSTFTFSKPGDFVYRKLKSGNEWISIHKKVENGKVLSFVDFWKHDGQIHPSSPYLCYTDTIVQQREATPEEKQLLIQAMLQQEEIFDEKTCTLVKLRPGTFIIVKTSTDTWYSIFKEIRKGVLFSYIDVDSCFTLWTGTNGLCDLTAVQDIRLATREEEELCMGCLKKHGLIWNKVLLSTEAYKDEVEFKPFQQVLSRDEEYLPWHIDFFSHRMRSGEYMCLTGVHKYCIPFEENKDKLGKI